MSFNLLAHVEALACLMVIIRILTARRADKKHSYIAGIGSWLLLVGSGSVLIRILAGIHTSPDWGEVLINVTIAAVVWAVGGDTAQLFKRKG
ncbi:phage holin family protein [Pantoea sp. YU22]|uniref:phage holin family protein n=1 Tax=Pantoea sp. YU22 TaxID=2497684 RepID=UPI000F88224B|nr:phage holin family protein [Pantoea sp. YU22]